MAGDLFQLASVAVPAAVTMGLIHGTEPGHGWLLAVLHSLEKGGISRALLYTTILAVGHFSSTVLVVGGVWILKSTLEQYLLVLQVASGVMLLALGARMALKYLRERRKGAHEHGHAGPKSWEPREMFKYAFLLGLAHEEEVALAGFILVGANPAVLALAYSIAVYAAMAAWTVASFYLITRFSSIEHVLERNVHILSAVILMGVGSVVLIEALREAM